MINLSLVSAIIIIHDDLDHFSAIYELNQQNNSYIYKAKY
jgi:hypothetical protein